MLRQIAEILANYQRQAVIYADMIAVYQEEQIHMAKDGAAEKPEAMLRLSEQKRELLAAVEAECARAEVLKRAVMAEFELSDFRLSLLRPYISEAEELQLQQAFSRLEEVLRTLRALDTQYQHLVRDYLKSREATPKPGQFSEALESYKESIWQGEFLKGG